MSQPVHNPLPLVSIVVCTHNRAEMLRGALASLTSIEIGPDFACELVVIDNNSSDATPQVFDEVAPRFPFPARRVFESHPGVVFARNRGVAESRGEWIAFFDDDELADPGWLRELLAMAHEKQVRCVGGGVILTFPDGLDRELSPVSRMLLGETVGMDAPRRFDHRVTPTCGNLLLHRSVFDEVGLFDPAYNRRGEDTDLFLRIYHRGIEAWFNPAALTHHVTPPNRLTDEYLRNMSLTMVRGMAQQERDACGRWLYPAVWVARVGQAAFVLFPRWLSAKLAGNHDRLVGAACRLTIARGYLRDGWKLICGSAPEFSS